MSLSDPASRKADAVRGAVSPRSYIERSIHLRRQGTLFVRRWEADFRKRHRPKIAADRTGSSPEPGGLAMLR